MAQRILRLIRQVLGAEAMELEALVRIEAKLDVVLQLTGRILRMAKITQADLDAVAANLVSTKGLLAEELQKLKDANPDLDLSGVNAAVADIASLVPSAVTPGTPPIAADPTTEVTPDPESTDQGGDPADVPPSDATSGPLDPDTPAVAEAAERHLRRRK